MLEVSFLQEWTRLVESLATISIIVTGLRLMLGIEKSSEALKHIAAILGLTILLLLAPAILLNLWSGIPLWQRIGLASLVIGVWLWRQSQRPVRKQEHK